MKSHILSVNDMTPTEDEERDINYAWCLNCHTRQIEGRFLRFARLATKELVWWHTGQIGGKCFV